MVISLLGSEEKGRTKVWAVHCGGPKSAPDIIWCTGRKQPSKEEIAKIAGANSVPFAHVVYVRNGKVML